MPTVDVDLDELRRLTGHGEKDDEALKGDLFDLGLEYEGETADGLTQLEFEADRLDRLSVEGIARSLRYQYGDDRGVYVPDANDADWTIRVDESVPDERPYVTGAVVRGVDLDEAALDSLIQIQEKLHATMGRKRAKGAIGIHDLAMLKGRSADAAEQGADAAEHGSDATEHGSDATEHGADGPAADREPEYTGDPTPDERTAGAADPTSGGTIEYRGVAPDGDTFVPLDSDAELTPAEVLDGHHIGTEYADIVDGYERYPAIYDDLGLFSFPPVVNGRRTELTTGSRELFVEMTGTDQWTIDKMLNIVCYALDARGATIERVAVEYPDRTVERPDFEVREKRVAHDRVESTLGLDLDVEAVVDLAERSGLDATATERGDDEVVYEVGVPPYRVDVLHPLDVVDDIGRAYGFNALEPRTPGVATIGGRHERSRHERAVRETLVGLGFQDLLNFHLASEAATFDRMGLPADEWATVEASGEVVGAGKPARITTPYSADYELVRTWALPSVVQVLSNNTHRAYPQDLAEIGLAAHVDPEANTGLAEYRTVAGVVARHDASYEDARGRLQGLARAFGVELETPPTEHPSFIDGRAAEVVLDGVSVGVVGELEPAVLVEHDLEVPVAGFEFRLDGLA